MVSESNLDTLERPLEKSVSDPLEFTKQAAGKVKVLLEEESNDKLKLRVYITGGGCSGFQYGFTFDEKQQEDDSMVSQDGVALLIDSMSIQYMFGAKIDYIEDIQGARFVIDNPNATTTCGCGSSFGV